MSAKVWIRVGVIAGVLLAQGCENAGHLGKETAALSSDGRNSTQPQAASTTPDEVVKGRAGERWRAVIEGEYKRAYDFLTPATRKLVSFIEYKASLHKTPFIWKDLKSVDVSCDQADVCTASLELSYVYMGGVVEMRGQEMRHKTQEKWLHTKGNWYYVSR